MCSYFTPLLWKHLSYSTEEQLCDKPKLEHVQTLHLALSSEAAHMPALLERVVCFIWMLPALRYAHVSLLLEHVWPEFEPQPVPEPSKRQSTGTRSSTRVVPTKQPNLKSARKAPKREPNWEKLMEQELGTAFDANKTPATWIMQFNARRDPISGRSEAQLPELHSLPKALIKMRQVDVSDGDTILLFNDQIVQLPQPRGLVDPQAVATAESDKVVSSDAMLGCQLPNRLQLDVAVRDLTDGPREFLQSVASNVTHMRIGSAGGRWIDYPKREVDDERQGPLHYHMFTHQRISWPIALNEAGHRFSALTDLSLHVDKQEDLEDLRNLLELFSPTVVNIDVRLESHLLQCLMRLVDDLKSDFYRPELSFPRLKTVTLYYAGPAWEKDNRADDVEAFKYDPYDTLRSLTTRIVGVREESMRSMKAWERLSRKAEGDEELRPLKEDLCAMLAGYWRQRGVEFKLLGVDPLPFTYTWPVSLRPTNLSGLF